MHTYESLTHGTPVYVSALHRFGTDGLLLADFSQPRPGDRAADLCSGCGVVALRWHDQGHRGPCDGVEIDREASALLAQSLENCPEAAAHIRPVRPGRLQSPLLHRRLSERGPPAGSGPP